MIAFNFFYKILMFPLYYFFHYNLIFGSIFKNLIKNFKYKQYIFELKNCTFPLPFYSSFIFNTYELNDRILIEKNLTNKHKCIIIGGGIGFIAVLTYWLTKNKIIIFEINKKIIKNLTKNLLNNKTIFKLYSSNLLLSKKYKKKYFYLNKNFLANSIYRKTKKKIIFKNIFYKKIPELKNYNTLIIDGEGVEKHYIQNINKLKKIKYMFFEFHNDIFNDRRKIELFGILKKNGFNLQDKFINSYYFVKK